MKHASGFETALAERAGTPCPNPYELLGPVRTLRRRLKLTPNDIAVLTALISFLPRDGREPAGGRNAALTVVFPSNALLSERANAMDERTLRRCIGRLVAAQLIERRSSANGKRFPLRYGGEIRDAFGFDLRLLIEGHPMRAREARCVLSMEQRLRSLRSEALALRAAATQKEGLSRDEQVSLESVRNQLRRTSLSIRDIISIIRGLRAIGASARPGFGEAEVAREPQGHDPKVGQTADSPVKDGRNDRHKESQRKDFIRKSAGPAQLHTSARTRGALDRDPSKMSWQDFQNISECFPHPPRSESELSRIIHDLAKMLRIGSDRLQLSLSKAGPGRLLLAFDYLLSKAETVRRPGAYLERMLLANSSSG